MSDLILNIAQKPTARRMIKRLRLPIPMPQKIRRADGAWSERPLNDQRILLAPQKSALGERIPQLLAAAGANVVSQESAGEDRVVARDRIGAGERVDAEEHVARGFSLEGLFMKVGSTIDPGFRG